MTHQLLNICNGNWVNTGKGFVQQHEIWPGRQSTGNFKATTLSPRQRKRRSFAQMGNVKFLKKRIELLSSCTPIFFDDFKDCLDVVFDRKSTKN